MNIFRRKKSPPSYTCMLYELEPHEVTGVTVRSDVPGLFTTLLRKDGEAWISVTDDELSGEALAIAWREAFATVKSSAEKGECVDYGDSGLSCYTGQSKDAVTGLLLHFADFPSLQGERGTLLVQYDKHLMLFARVGEETNVREMFRVLLNAFVVLAKEDGLGKEIFPSGGWWYDGAGYESWTLSEARSVSPGPRLKALLKAQS